MLHKIKNKIDKELGRFVFRINKLYSLSYISPLLYNTIKEFVLRKGKRIRPILFVVGYLGFAKRKAKNLYTSALSLELLHDFMLIHDDIIDNSDLRRGKPSTHKMLDDHLGNYKNIKFSGKDLAIVLGDVMYAIAIDAFLSIQEKPQHKEEALKRFIQAAIYTGSGEFIELLSGIKSLEKITKQDIYKIYDYKTAYYTFSSPLATGAILAGAKKTEVEKLSRYGIFLGRAFQIKDDILGIFGDEKKTGKSAFTDLQEAKKTLLIWYAYKHSSKKDKYRINKTLPKQKISSYDLEGIRKIICKTGTLDYVIKEVGRLIKRSKKLLESSKIKPRYKNFLFSYAEKILTL